ncbi:ribonuclease R [Natranaerofaba carboxydovora]|uniref:ribonuclease R n=1 Tax=Natranaerofaba carboxydovora TaxID=2742683 RepID=UPI001F13989B|nr:ribonuclease R [Natranaerofaba carboxydovora]UMZ72664.1 Ribonuclease R [Natranaerofaba carboxydovora]
MTFRDNIISYLKDEASRPVSFEELKKALKVNKKKQTKRLSKIVEKLIEDGSLVRTRHGYYGVPERMNLVVGMVQGNSKGFAFLIPEEASNPDIFLSPNDLHGALHGDKVVARVHKEGGSDKRPEGEVVRILERGSKEIVGTFEKSKAYGFVLPDDNRFSKDIFVGKDEMKDVKHGEKVVAKIVEWPKNDKKSPVGVIERIIGDPGDPGVDVESIVYKYGMSLDFPEKVQEHLEKVPDEIRPEDKEERRMLQDLDIVTIDGADAKDLDDAVSLERLDNGNYRLGVHIADVSYYVKEGTPLDLEARERGTSVYLVDRVLPMLPPKLSNNICSLNPKIERLCMSALIEISPKGEVSGYEFTPSVIKTNHRLTYDEVNEIFAGEDKELEEKYSDVVDMLWDMKELAETLRENRFTEGAIDFDFPEPEVLLDESGKPTEIRTRPRGHGERLIEEFMLAANKVVATFFYEADYPFVYRVHEEPDEDRVSDFRTFVQKLGYSLPKIKGEMRPIYFQKLLEEVKGKKEEKVVSQIMLRSMKQARYATENLGHFGLAFKYYTHFTSPIRRYPDLIVHRLIREKLNTKELKKARRKRLEQKLTKIAYHSSLREQEATEAERESVDLKMAEYMERHIGDEFDGIISSVTSFGMFVELPNLVEGLVHVSSMTDDYYNYDENTHSLVGERTGKIFRVGDEIKIRVTNVVRSEQSVDFELV